MKGLVLTGTDKVWVMTMEMNDCRSVEDKTIQERGVRELRGRVVGSIIYVDIEVTKE